MNDFVAPEFTIKNYPKSYAAIDRLRLQDYAALTESQQKRIFEALERFCFARVEHIPPLQEYKGYPFLGSGWEWSVFRKDVDTVIKVAAGMFPEVDSPEYLENMQHLYGLLGKQYPEEMLATTTFYQHDGGNILEQQFVDGVEDVMIRYDVADTWLLRRLVVFFEATASLLQKVMWMPDYWLTEGPNGFLLRNVLIDQRRGHFKIVDVSRYLDPSRMYPSLRDWCYESDTHRVQQLLKWSSKRLREIF